MALQEPFNIKKKKIVFLVFQIKIFAFRHTVINDRQNTNLVKSRIFTPSNGFTLLAPVRKQKTSDLDLKKRKIKHIVFMTLSHHPPSSPSPNK